MEFLTPLFLSFSLLRSIPQPWFQLKPQKFSFFSISSLHCNTVKFSVVQLGSDYFFPLFGHFTRLWSLCGQSPFRPRFRLNTIAVVKESSQVPLLLFQFLRMLYKHRTFIALAHDLFHLQQPPTTNNIGITLRLF